MAVDYLTPFKIPFFVMKSLGAWQEKHSSWRYRFWGLLVHLVSIDLFVFYHSVYLYKALKKGDYKEFFKALKMCILMFSIMFKSFWFIVKINPVRRFLEDLKVLVDLGGSNYNDRPKFTAAITKIVKIVKGFYLTACLSVITTFSISLIMFKQKVLMYESWTYWDYKTNDIAYWGAQANQLLLCFYGVSVDYGSDLMPIILMALATGLLQELAESIENENFDTEKKFDDLIERHVKLKELVGNISESLSTILMLQAACSAFILCASAFLLTMVRNFVFS